MADNQVAWSRRGALLGVGLLALLSLGGALAVGRFPVSSEVGGPASATGAIPVSGAIGAPAGYQMPPLRQPHYRAASTTDDGAVRAVAIVGDVGDGTLGFRADMERAVAALQAHGATVARFYYGDTAFTWSDVVAATEGAHLLLYMGHGVYWGGTCTNPTSVGGFYLGDGQFVTPDALRSDLAGRLAADAVMIFSHACFSAGSTACDAVGSPGVAEAQRRVTMYADPFVDLGFEAVFANNYFESAEGYVNRLLEPLADRDPVGEIFLATYPNLASNYVDLAFPAIGYDLWSNGIEGAWNHAFVGRPSYTFGGSLRVPELGGLPDSVGFLFSVPDATIVPTSLTIVPQNVGTSDLLTWTVMSDGDWFSIDPGSGTTPAGFTVVPDGTPKAAGRYSGVITVTVVSPADVLGTPRRIDLALVVTNGVLRSTFLPLVARAIP